MGPFINYNFLMFIRGAFTLNTLFVGMMKVSRPG